MKAKGVAGLGICGVAAMVANAVYNAIGVPVRHCPITLDKLPVGCRSPRDSTRAPP
jgi:xanthine dehydrogenase YagR molybdenum-binding subunit